MYIRITITEIYEDLKEECMRKYKIDISLEQAIYCLKAGSERYPEVCEECELYGIVGDDHCYDDATDVAIKSLQKQVM